MLKRLRLSVSCAAFVVLVASGGSAQRQEPPGAVPMIVVFQEHLDFSVFRGQYRADDRAERPAEGAQAGEADVEADVGDAPIGLAQQEHRPLYPPPLQVAVRRLAERGPEYADEVRLRDEGDLREPWDVERLRVVAVHRVAGAQHAAVRLFDGATHGLSSRMTAGERLRARVRGRLRGEHARPGPVEPALSAAVEQRRALRRPLRGRRRLPAATG